MTWKPCSACNGICRALRVQGDGAPMQWKVLGSLLSHYLPWGVGAPLPWVLAEYVPKRPHSVVWLDAGRGIGCASGKIQRRIQRRKCRYLQVSLQFFFTDQFLKNPSLVAYLYCFEGHSQCATRLPRQWFAGVNVSHCRRVAAAGGARSQSKPLIFPATPLNLKIFF